MLGQLHRTLIFPGCIAACILAVAGCSGSRQSTQDSGGGSGQKNFSAPLSEYEATLNPADYDQEVAPAQKAAADDKSSFPLDLSRDSVTVQEEQTRGFRIQVFSSISIDEATASRMNAQQLLPTDSVYIVFDPPVYKIRIGDFASRYEADQHMPTIVQKGFKDAWIVPDQIVRRKLVVVPRPKPSGTP